MGTSDCLLVEICTGTILIPCPVTIDVNSGVTGIFCRSLSLTAGKVFGHRLFPRIHPLLLPQMKSIFPNSRHNRLSWNFVIKNWSFFHCCCFCHPIHHHPECPFTQPKCIIHFKFVSSISLFLRSSINRLRLNLFCSESKVVLLSVHIATGLSLWCTSWSSSNFSNTFKIAIYSAWLCVHCACSWNFSWCINFPLTNIITAAPLLSPILLPSVNTSVVYIAPFCTSLIIASSAGRHQFLTSSGAS